ncbi:hypothetical protein Hanom_Chr04g00330811 [Helianthus anomalus]
MQDCATKVRATATFIAGMARWSISSMTLTMRSNSTSRPSDEWLCS